MQDHNTELIKRQCRILIADDCEHTRALIAIALDEEHFELEFFTDGQDAMSAYQDKVYDLAILDVQMPGETGINVCKRIKENQTNAFTPVILLTSQAELADKVNGLNCGADEYITKPFALPELKARVNALLRIKDLADSLRETKDELEAKDKQLVAMQVAGAAAHELGQPLTAILLNCELVARIDPESPIFNETLYAIQQQCNTMRAILNQFNRVNDYRTKNYLGAVEILDIGSDTSEAESA